MHFVVTARDRRGAGQLRAATRPAHLEHMAGHSTKVVVAGALLDDQGDPAASLFIFRAADASAVKAVMDADPYFTAGVFETVTIEPWRWVVNKPEGEE